MVCWIANGLASLKGFSNAYGLDNQDLIHILQTSPGMAKKRAGFMEYIRSNILHVNQEGVV